MRGPVLEARALRIILSREIELLDECFDFVPRELALRFDSAALDEARAQVRREHVAQSLALRWIESRVTRLHFEDDAHDLIEEAQRVRRSRGRFLALEQHAIEDRLVEQRRDRTHG